MSQIKVERLSFRDIDSARISVENAFEEDPLCEYLRDKQTKKSGFLKGIISSLQLDARFVLAVHTKTAFTVDHGKALAIYVPAASSAGKPRPTPLKLFLQQLVKILSYTSNWLNTPEQKKKYEGKLADLVRDGVGKKVNEMVFLHGLATSPEHQGKGYGTALVKTVTDIADAEGRECYLLSSNINNTSFYNSCGFYSFKETVFGADNPTWKKDPIVVPLMVRAAKGKEPCEKSLLMG
ncbi:hypothetical protein EW145_g5086 [Phellinidium pouzarii]|uniref:N-acetyltransferase domain-containing protein n=1 Tax=Phellinidium pouzarii TaxID=167371 RepID=A0A4S4L1A2_9AGAM|nr:hypothetical protein EW145_g5086 [Phellinidium pouzarii]